jgi:hypothetical protein
MNDLVTTALWDNAVRDRDAEEAREALVYAKVAVAGLWPFLAAAQTQEEFGHRLALQTDTILDRVGFEFDSVVASLAEDWETLREARQVEQGLRVEAASKVADGQDPMVYPAVAMYATAAGDDHHYQVDHIASPKWLKTIHRGADEAQARQAAREFAVSQGMPLYVDGHRVEGRVHNGQEFFHVESGQWLKVAAWAAPDEVHDQFKGLNEICAGTGMRAHGATHDCPHCGQTVPTTSGRGGKTFAMTHWAPGAGIFDKVSAWTIGHEIHPSAVPKGHYILHDGQWGQVSHILDHEDGGTTFTIGSGGQRHVGPDETVRVASPGEIEARHHSAFTPDPSDAQRYNRYPIPTQVPVGGDVVANGNTQGPDGFPIDISEGEQRSPEAYARQLTPGAWTVTPGTEWRDSTRPNAATGMPEGQWPSAGNAATGSLVPMPNETQHQFATRALATLQRAAGEGVVPTAGPNPNYFSQGTQGLAGPSSFPEDPGPEPKTDNRVDDVYGAVPPQVSSGSTQGQTDGQGYSRQGVEGSLQSFADYHYIRENNGKFEVFQKGTGKTLSTHDTREDAEASFRAMMMHKHQGSAEPRPFAEAGAPHLAAFNDSHVTDYVNWAHSEGHDPDHPKTLKRYEALPGIGKAHTNHIADQLYIGSGDADWRKSAATDGRIVGHCDNCHAPVRWHQGDGEHELRHLHNGSNRCDHGGMSAKTADMSSDPSNPNLQPAQSQPGTSDTNVPQATDPQMPGQVTGMRHQADALEAPTAENPTGRGEDEYRARNWDSMVKQRPMQTPEDRNVNTPVMPADPIRTLDTDGPRERRDSEEDETDNEPAGREASLRQEASMTPVICMSCGARGKVAKITASLVCRCGSADLDVDDFETTAAQHVAHPVGPGTGWGKPMPDPLQGWSDYQGPLPGRNPQMTPPVSDNMICPSCHGAGYDVSDKTLCRMCNGRGTVKPTTGRPDVQGYDATTNGPPIGGARWQGATASARVVAPIEIVAAGGGGGRYFGGGGGGVSTANSLGASGTFTIVSGRPSKADPYGTAEYQNMHGAPGSGSNVAERTEEFNPEDKRTFYPKADTMSPATRHRQQPDYDAPTGRHYQMNGATCPNCGHTPTELRKDTRGDAWWVCPNKECGPLANIDQHPEVNPYDTERNVGMKPNKSMKVSKLRRTRKTGKLLSMLATIHSANQGIDPAEAIEVARRTIITYREN